ncbi:transporter [uncultured Tenacibaculum sp.]|uniref:transporter n=1 Tax=uncultured Tenacibaculum sp. TaxID=174713 RepID=UPI002605B3FD|nr:transporter [uncultured Tenacibaculum sp.]
MKKLAYFLLFCLTVNTYAQSPWTQKKGEAYLQLNFTTIPSYSDIFGNPDFQTEREISDNTLQLYAEYGISDKTTLIANLPLKFVSTGDLVNASPVSVTAEGSETSLGNIQLGVRHNFYNKKWLISGQLMVVANTGSFDAATGLRTGYDAWTFTPVISAGRGFDKWYIQAFTGVDIRTNEYSSAFKLGGEAGYKVGSWLWLAGFLDGVASFQNGEVQQPITNLLTSLYVNDQSYAAFGFKIIGEINKNFGANVGLGGALSGRRVAKSPALSFGLYYKL